MTTQPPVTVRVIASDGEPYGFRRYRLFRGNTPLPRREVLAYLRWSRR